MSVERYRVPADQYEFGPVVSELNEQIAEILR